MMRKDLEKMFCITKKRESQRNKEGSVFFISVVVLLGYHQVFGSTLCEETKVSVRFISRDYAMPDRNRIASHYRCTAITGYMLLKRQSELHFPRDRKEGSSFQNSSAAFSATARRPTL